MELFARKWCQPDRTLQLFRFIAKHPKEVNYISIDIIVGLDRRRFPIKKHRCGPGKRFAIMVCTREQRQQPIKMAELPSIPTEHDPAAVSAWPRDRTIGLLCS